MGELGLPEILSIAFTGGVESVVPIAVNGRTAEPRLLPAGSRFEAGLSVYERVVVADRRRLDRFQTLLKCGRVARRSRRREERAKFSTEGGT